MNFRGTKLDLIFLFICGLALVGILVGMLAHLSDTVIRICGGVMLVAMVVLAYRVTKAWKSN